jgi:hypothetical protein
VGVGGWLGSSQCCQVAEILAEKAQKGPEKKSWPEEFVAENWPNFFQNWPNFFHVLAGK